MYRPKNNILYVFYLKFRDKLINSIKKAGKPALNHSQNFSLTNVIK